MPFYLGRETKQGVIILYKLVDEVRSHRLKEFCDLEALQLFLKNDNSMGFVAEVDGKIIGFAFGYILHHPEGSGSEFYLHAIDIAYEYQNKGYGTGLMEFIKEQVKIAGCNRMFLVTKRGNVRAISMFEKTGGVHTEEPDIIYEWSW